MGPLEGEEDQKADATSMQQLIPAHHTLHEDSGKECRICRSGEDEGKLIRACRWAVADSCSEKNLPGVGLQCVEICCSFWAVFF